jgi:hypothetical protein
MLTTTEATAAVGSQSLPTCYCLSAAALLLLPSDLEPIRKPERTAASAKAANGFRIGSKSLQGNKLNCVGNDRLISSRPSPAARFAGISSSLHPFQSWLAIMFVKNRLSQQNCISSELQPRIMLAASFRGANATKEWVDGGQGQVRAVNDLVKTKANIVRLPWNLSSADSTITKDLMNKVTSSGKRVILDNHGHTGKNTSMDTILKQWEPWKEYIKARPNVIINIANEWGGTGANAISDTTWRDGYVKAVETMRSWGWKNTLVVDGNEWGQSPRAIKEYGQEILGKDPSKNVWFSVHPYAAWTDTKQAGKNDLETEFAAIKGKGLKLFVGEFNSRHAKGGYKDRSVINAAEKHAIGWTAWSWTDAPASGPSAAFEDDAPANTTRGGQWDSMSTFGRDLTDAFDDGKFNNSNR